MCRIGRGYTFLLLRSKPQLAGNPIRSQGSMTSYVNDVIMWVIHIKAEP